MQLGDLCLPVAGLSWLATDPDFRRVGLGTHLLMSASCKWLAAARLIGLLRTRNPHFFRRTGSALCGRNACAAAPAQAIVSRLADEHCRSRKRSRVQIRPWRRWEEEALARIYRQNQFGSFGLLDRSRATWHWMLERRAFDQFYVALDGPDLADLREQTTRVVGYAAVCGDRVVELMTSPGHEKSGDELLARVCADAIEHDRYRVVLHASPLCPLLELVRQAGNHLRQEAFDCGEVAMARLLDPLGMLQAICPQLALRAGNAGLPVPLELGLLVEGRKFQIEIGRQGALASADHMGRSYLKLNVADFTRLTLGQLDWLQAFADGRVVASTALARETASLLFPEPHPSGDQRWTTCLRGSILAAAEIIQ